MTTPSIGVFPSGLQPKSVKDSKIYGISVAKAILGATQEQRKAFKKELYENRKYAEGNQDVKSYLKELEIDANNMYGNISYKPRPIAPKFKNIVVSGYLRKSEYPSVTATSKHIQDAKDKKKSDANFRMEYAEQLAMLSQEAGIPLIDNKEFTPESKEESDLYFSMNDKEKEELLMQQMVDFALKDNDIESLKAYSLDDQFVGQLHGYYNTISPNGRLIIDYIQPEDAILDNSRKEDFSDCSFKGRYVRYKISEIRAKFKLTSNEEKALFGCAKSAMGQHGNPNRALNWEEDYRVADYRPYDDYTIELMHIWWKTSKVLTYTEGKDKFGRQIFDYTFNSNNNNKNVKSDGRKKLGEKYPETAYEGYFTADASLCLEWGEQKNILRDGEDKDTLLCNFIFFMPFNKGRMLPKSLMSLMKDSIRNMDIAVLKIKQAIIKSTPDDYMIDIDSLDALDLGNGQDLQPLDIIQIHQQTGRLFYRSKDEDGNPIQPPIRAQFNPIDSKIQAYINWYNTELNNIRDYLGVNEFRDGSATAERTGFRFMQAQNEASNTATWFIYRAYLKSMQELIRQIGIRIWDALNYGDVNKGYLKYLGKENVEFIQNRKDITASSYDIEFKIGIDGEDKLTLERYIETCLQNGSLEMPDVLMLNRIKDPMIAEKMLIFTYNKRKKEKLEEQRANQESASRYASDAGVAVEQAKQQFLMAQLQAQQTNQQAKDGAEQIATLLKGAMELIKQSFVTGTPIPPQYQPLIEVALQNASMKTNNSLNEAVQLAEAQEEAEMQQQLTKQIEDGIKSGDITEDQATQIAQEEGLI